jgi:hypothetical protein
MRKRVREFLYVDVQAGAVVHDELRLSKDGFETRGTARVDHVHLSVLGRLRSGKSEVSSLGKGQRTLRN